jgi:pyruvate dehydrogenase E1 component alpha subunit
MPGVVVDGNDVMAVYEVTTEAVKRARAGEGPTLIECKTYRLRGHFEGDACVYRAGEETDEWKTKDPIARFEDKLLEMQVLTKEKIEEIKTSIEEEVTDAVRFAEESPWPDLSERFEDVYTL